MGPACNTGFLNFAVMGSSGSRVTSYRPSFLVNEVPIVWATTGVLSIIPLFLGGSHGGGECSL